MFTIKTFIYHNHKFFGLARPIIGIEDATFLDSAKPITGVCVVDGVFVDWVDEGVDGAGASIIFTAPDDFGSVLTDLVS